jgi:hypothetical protein
MLRDSCIIVHSDYQLSPQGLSLTKNIEMSEVARIKASVNLNAIEPALRHLRVGEGGNRDRQTS